MSIRASVVERSCMMSRSVSAASVGVTHRSSDVIKLFSHYQWILMHKVLRFEDPARSPFRAITAIPGLVVLLYQK